MCTRILISNTSCLHSLHHVSAQMVQNKSSSLPVDAHIHTHICTHTAADGSNFSCDFNTSQPLCPGTISKCTCTVNDPRFATRWFFNAQTQCGNTFISLAQSYPCDPPYPSSSDTCGPYLIATNNPSNSSCSISTLTITANPSLNGLVVECRDTSTSYPGVLYGTRNISVSSKHIMATMKLFHKRQKQYQICCSYIIL